MTVKELIEHLQTLEQDKGIWVVYDSGCSIFAPVPDARIDGEYTLIYHDNVGIQEGDYVITAG